MINGDNPLPDGLESILWSDIHLFKDGAPVAPQIASASDACDARAHVILAPAGDAPITWGYNASEYPLVKLRSINAQEGFIEFLFNDRDRRILQVDLYPTSDGLPHGDYRTVSAEEYGRRAAEVLRMRGGASHAGQS